MECKWRLDHYELRMLKRTKTLDLKHYDYTLKTSEQSFDEEKDYSVEQYKERFAKEDAITFGAF